MSWSPLQPKHKWGKDRPWYWRLGGYSCGGSCQAEFPNYHFRNAHDVRFHPGAVLAGIQAGEMGRGQGTYQTTELSRPWKVWEYFRLCILGIFLFIVSTLPRWISQWFVER